MTLKRMSVKVSEDLYDWISKESETRGLTMNAVIIFALENYQEKKETLSSVYITKSQSPDKKMNAEKVGVKKSGE